MITQELIDYIKEQLNEGIDKEEIKKALLDVGWQIEDIEEGFRLLEQGEFKVPQPEFRAEPEPKFEESIAKPEPTPEVESPIESETKVEPELKPRVEATPEVTFEPKAQPQPEPRLEPTPQYKPEFEFKPETLEKEQTVSAIETPQQPLTEPLKAQPEIQSTRSEKEWLQPPSFMSSGYQPAFPSKKESALAGLSSSLLFKIFAILTLVVFVITLGVMIYIFLRPKPLDVVETSINKLFDADSVLVKFQGDELVNLDNVRGTIYRFKDDSLYSKAELEIMNLGSQKNNTLTLAIIYNKDNAFLQLTYDGLNEFLENITKEEKGEFISAILQSKTYSIIEPVLIGEKWLHFPLEDFSNKSQEKRSQKGLSEKDIERIKKDLKNTMVIRYFDSNFEIEGKKFYRIGVGLDKEKFIAFLESLKNYNLDINLQDLNDLIKSIRSIKNWEAGQVEFVISKKDKILHSLSLTLPAVSLQELQNQSLFQGFSNLPSKPESSISQYLPFFGMWLQQKSGSPTKIPTIRVGTINFSQYNSLSAIEPPANVVNLEELKSAISEEQDLFLGILLALFFGGSELFTPEGLQPQLPESLQMQP